MGFFSNLWSKAKGVLGRVWDGAKKVVPKVAGVLSRVADLPIIRDLPFVSTINNIYKKGKSLYDTFVGNKPLAEKIKDASDDVVDVIDVIKGSPGIKDNVDAARDSARRFVDASVKPHLNNTINSKVLEPVMRKLSI